MVSLEGFDLRVALGDGQASGLLGGLEFLGQYAGRIAFLLDDFLQVGDLGIEFVKFGLAGSFEIVVRLFVLVALDAKGRLDILIVLVMNLCDLGGDFLFDDVFFEIVEKGLVGCFIADDVTLFYQGISRDLFDFGILFELGCELSLVDCHSCKLIILLN